jgi:hypothetical protein
VKDESENQGCPHPCADDLDVHILGLMCEGMPHIAISRKLGLGMRTVRRRIGRMMKETESPIRFTFGATLYRQDQRLLEPGVSNDPRRWVAEQTFGRLMFLRRTSRRLIWL